MTAHPVPSSQEVPRGLVGLLLLADGRLPAGGHAHSGGVEPAVDEGAVVDVMTLRSFLRGRLATAGLVGAAFAAAACFGAATTTALRWDRLDGELDARTPSAAQRRASRAQGRALLRAASACWPAGRWAELRGDPHHPVALGVAAAAAGCTAAEAALCAALASVTGPATAAIRLLGLDPVEVYAVLADLSGEVRGVAGEGGRSAGARWSDLPASTAPLLDVRAEIHGRTDGRLFAS